MEFFGGVSMGFSMGLRFFLEGFRGFFFLC